jgi:hypothetical protein
VLTVVLPLLPGSILRREKILIVVDKFRTKGLRLFGRVSILDDVGSLIAFIMAMEES